MAAVGQYGYDINGIQVGNANSDQAKFAYMLGALQQLVANTGGSAGGPGGGGSGTQRTPGVVAATGGGNVAAGSRSVSFSTSSDFAGTIGGATFGASQTVGFNAAGNDTIGAIAYTVSAGTLYIATLT